MIMRNKPRCKKCGSVDTVKNGHNRCGTQRYKCKCCHSVFVWKYNIKDRVPTHRYKAKILQCYMEGMGVRSICRVFKISNRTLQLWIAREGKTFKQPDISEEKFVSCDEMWTYVQKKRGKDGYG